MGTWSNHRELWNTHLMLRSSAGAAHLGRPIRFFHCNVALRNADRFPLHCPLDHGSPKTADVDEVARVNRLLENYSSALPKAANVFETNDPYAPDATWLLAGSKPSSRWWSRRTCPPAERQKPRAVFVIYLT